VIEIDESWEAPHAIENSKRVYVRTGNAANPYDLANVDLIIELIKRRAEPSSRYEQLIALARNRAIHAHIGIAPLYTRRALCTNEDVWAFLDVPQYRGARYFPQQTLRRVSDGVASFNREQEYSQISAFGLLFTKRLMEAQHQEGRPEVIPVRETFHPLLKLLHCANAFYTHVGYRGNLQVDVAPDNVRAQRMPFLEDPYGFHDLGDYQCFEDRVSVSERSSAELLQQDAHGIVQNVLRQLCWSFWQSPQEFPAAALHRNIERVIVQMGV
jgi:hypothetical protein